MQTAYSYLRFSTPGQASAEKLRTQLEQAREYAKVNGLILDEDFSFQDLGMSAYRGANSRVGRLGDFLLAAQHGLVKRGSYLLVESLDRISRDSARRAFRTLGNICDEGITVVTLIDEQIYTAEILDRDPAALIVSIVIFMRANDESTTKSKRIKSALRRKMQKIRCGEKVRLFGSIPSWLTLENDLFVVEKEKAKSVRMIFHLAELGIGTTAIAKALNLNKMPTLGSSTYWGKSRVNLLLNNIAVTGTLITSTYEIIDGKKVPLTFRPFRGYYPRLISQKTWNKAQFYVAARKKKFKADNNGARFRKVRNIFAYTSKCPLCGNAMNLREYRYRGDAPRKITHRLVCALAINGGECVVRSVIYESLETAFLEKGPDMMRAHVSLSVEEATDKSSFRQHEYLLLEPRVSAMIESMKDLEQNRGQFNYRFRKIIRSVVINYPDKRLDFKWVYGGRTSMHIADIGDPQLERISIQSDRKTLQIDA